MQAWQTRTAQCLHEEEGLAKHVHLGGCLSGVCYRANEDRSTIKSKINDTPIGVYLPISKLHSISAVANLLAHNNL